MKIILSSGTNPYKMLILIKVVWRGCVSTSIGNQLQFYGWWLFHGWWLIAIKWPMIVIDCNRYDLYIKNLTSLLYKLSVFGIIHVIIPLCYVSLMNHICLDKRRIYSRKLTSMSSVWHLFNNTAVLHNSNHGERRSATIPI